MNKIYKVANLQYTVSCGWRFNVALEVEILQILHVNSSEG
jgi:hypothetical protein